MKNITDELIEEIKLNSDILDVVSEYVKMVKKGKDYFGLCPFHQEKTPSFSVAPGKGIYYCFGCQSGGSVIQFIMNIENLSYIESLEFLAKRANIRLPQEADPRYAEISRKKETVLGINKKAAQYFFENLKKNSLPVEYLAGRKIRKDAAIHYGLGYADGKRDGLYSCLLKEGYSPGEMLEAGLVSASAGSSGGYYDKFRNRLIFPIFDVYGNVIAFGGRSMDGSEPKYLNSPETLVYKKGKHLYGLNFAKKTQNSYIAIVEGYIDVVMLYQEGFDCFTASLGTALTVEQARLANRYDKKIILCYDSDQAGNSATMRALEIFSGIGAGPSVAVLPDNSKDPDEYVRNHGGKAFKKVITEAMTPVEFKVYLLKKDLKDGSTDNKVRMFKSLINILSEIDDMTLIDMYASRYSKEFGISREAILNDVRRKKGDAETETTEGNTEIYKEKPDMIHEYELMMLLLYFNHKTGRDVIRGYFETQDASFPENIEKIYRLIFSTSRDLTFADILECAGKGGVPELMRYNRIVENIDDKEKALDDFISGIRNCKMEEYRKQLKKSGRNGGLSSEDIKKLREYSEMAKQIKKVKDGGEH